MICFAYFLGGMIFGYLGGFTLQAYLEDSSSKMAALLWLKGGTGLAFLFAFLHFGSLEKSLFYGTLGFFLLFISIVDLIKYIIPDKVLLSIALLYFLKEKFHFVFSDWINFSTLLGIALFLKIGYFWSKRKNGLGWGDVKFFSLCGLWINLEQLPLFLCLTGSFGVCLAYLWQYRGWGKFFPLGPATCFALGVVIFWF